MTFVDQSCREREWLGPGNSSWHPQCSVPKYVSWAVLPLTRVDGDFVVVLSETTNPLIVT